MKFKVGDRVRFLNESGGGVVSKIVNSNLVHVTIEDGFDIPTLPSELIKVESQKVPGRSFFNEAVVEEETPVQNTTIATESTDIALKRNSSLSYGKNAVPKGIYLSFSPQDQKFLVSGGINLYILNHTDYDIVYSWLVKSGDQYSVKDNDTLKAQQKILIDTYEREKLDEILKGVVQVLFQGENMEEIPLPVSSHYKVQGSKFYQENTYKREPLLNELAITVTVAEWSSVGKLNQNDYFSKSRNKYGVKQEKKEVSKPQKLIDKHKIALAEAEVDLHISALREDYNRMNSGEILNYQINYFRSTLESALTNQYQKVIFIHGIGNGVLKNKITTIIREEYPNLMVRNAQFLQYGNGAIEVDCNS